MATTPNTKNVLQVYTEANCQYECLAKEGSRICGCVPWNYPNPNMHGGEICDDQGAACFEAVLSNTTKKDGCKCLPDCNIVKYTYSYTSLPVEKDIICHFERGETQNNDRVEVINDNLAIGQMQIKTLFFLRL